MNIFSSETIPHKWDLAKIIDELRMDAHYPVDSQLVETIHKINLYLCKLGFELKGSQNSHGCFLTTFSENLKTLKTQMYRLEDKESIDLRRKILDIRKKMKKGQPTDSEKDLLVHYLNIPTRIVTVTVQKKISDRITFPDSRGKRKWKTLSEEERPKEFAFLVDLDGYFVYAKKLASASNSIQDSSSFKNIETDTDQEVRKTFHGRKITIQKNPDPFDSDDEQPWPEDEEELTIFNKQSRLLAQVMTIPCRDKEGNLNNIKGSELIELVHNIIQDCYFDVIDDACDYEKDLDGTAIQPPSIESDNVVIQKPADWFLTLGGWKGMAPNREVQKYFFSSFCKWPKKFMGAKIYDKGVTFPIINHRIHMTNHFFIGDFLVTKAWEKKEGAWQEVTGKTDLSYGQIDRAIDHIKEKYGLSDSDLARLQLSALSQYSFPYVKIWKKTPAPVQKEIMQFLNYLNALMFGIEASGLNAALATSLMALDLIVDGMMSYKQAFKANHDGGVYPYATFGNNQGTYTSRELLLLQKKEERNPLSMKTYRDNPDLSPVAVKEAILINKWLHFNKVIVKNERDEIQLKNIENAMNDLVNFYFFPWRGVFILEKFNSKFILLDLREELKQLQNL